MKRKCVCNKVFKMIYKHHKIPLKETLITQKCLRNLKKVQKQYMTVS